MQRNTFSLISILEITHWKLSFLYAKFWARAAVDGPVIVVTRVTFATATATTTTDRQPFEESQKWGSRIYPSTAAAETITLPSSSKLAQ